MHAHTHTRALVIGDACEGEQATKVLKAPLPLLSTSLYNNNNNNNVTQLKGQTEREKGVRVGARDKDLSNSVDASAGGRHTGVEHATPLRRAVNRAFLSPLIKQVMCQYSRR